jgi:hypothetical protein
MTTQATSQRRVDLDWLRVLFGLKPLRQSERPAPAVIPALQVSK